MVCVDWYHTLYHNQKISDSWIPQNAKDRAAALVSQMTLEEKCTLIHGTRGDGEYEDGFHIMPIPRLGIPAIRMADGPQGVRNKTHSTYYPCGLSLAASWNRDVAGKVGEGIGLDARARGVAIMLCPGVNIYRTALCGRNFEYYGEDPYLASETALHYIKGIQSKGVMATIKHFALNNQEFDRHGVSSNADERTINEIYFPAFRKAVEQGNVACVMTSYNPINGTHASEDPWLIKENLRGWGFEGIVMSDWTSTYSAIGCFTSGLDLEMPRGYVTNYENAKTLLEEGIISQEDIDEKCRHILQTVIAYGFLDNPVKDPSIPEDCDESRANALAAALEGPVLLKNNGLLPLKSSRKSIIVLGPNADTVPYGGGAGRMDPFEWRNITLYAGLSKLGKGYNVELMDWKSPDYEKIRKAGAVVVAAGFNYDTEGEDFDRSYALPQDQNELICAVADANPNTAVVVYSGGEVDVNPWIDKVGALMMAWYSGQEGGTALAQLLSGRVSPSGRLPFTFWGSLEANPAYPNYGISKPYGVRKEKRFSQYPFIEYNEGIFLGYRGMDHFDVEPMFPLGYGLTYSDFSYSGLAVKNVKEGYEVSFTVTNTGKKEASEVAQVYVSALDAAIPMPDLELKGYEKVSIGPKQSLKVSILLPASAFSHYDVSSHGWVNDTGTYRVAVGASARDIRLSEEISVR
ncbi:MAG: glycoside hydrolase family 3 C-terminal domain-containing protein [Bacteroidales bacterium]|nr:glycoside hydrolase family 3 C-terminal domain-containing protein [Bacteroidales bacterium]